MKIKLNSVLLSLKEGEVGYCVLEDKIFKTNEVAMDIIEYLESHKISSVEEIKKHIFDLYDVEEAKLESELRAFLDYLEKLNIILVS